MYGEEKCGSLGGDSHANFFPERVGTDMATQQSFARTAVLAAPEDFLGLLWDRIREIAPTLSPDRLEPCFCNGLNFGVSVRWMTGNGNRKSCIGTLPAGNARLLSEKEAADPTIPGVTSHHLRLRPTSHPILDTLEFAKVHCEVIPFRRLEARTFRVEKQN